MDKGEKIDSFKMKRILDYEWVNTIERNLCPFYSNLYSNVLEGTDSKIFEQIATNYLNSNLVFIILNKNGKERKWF